MDASAALVSNPKDVLKGPEMSTFGRLLDQSETLFSDNWDENFAKYLGSSLLESAAEDLIRES
ncbi:MAG: hypothetical protein ACI81L_001453 [Verrucomicrobiales bacterium]|jgi:hypothetical protein